MPLSQADLAKPIKWHMRKYETMLQDLQANILKGHGRPVTRNVFLRVQPGQGAAARAAVHALAPFITSAHKQLTDTERFKATGMSGGTVALFFLTKAGYDALGVPAAKQPNDPSFQAGMRAQRAVLADPADSTWDAAFASQPHAMLLLAGSSDAPLAVAEGKILALLGGGWVKSGDVAGQAIFDSHGQGIEHFGYMDGRSQPLMLAADVAKEPGASTGRFKWDPRFGPGDAALVKDPAGGTGDSFGSYFIFRKLQQDVQNFKAAEDALSQDQITAATNAGLPAPDSELAGAQIVGRFEDGGPTMTNKQPLATVPAQPDNNFNYSADPAGDKCPFHAHVRKVNPRDGSERGVIMPRRGIPFGGLEGTTTNPVGLLFMAYNKDIGRQFEFTQQAWANNPNFQRPNTNVDPIIGQGPSPRPKFQNCPISWGDIKSRKLSGDFQDFVKMKGGDYFFAPSLSGLASL